jgi:hypothetical protein
MLPREEVGFSPAMLENRRGWFQKLRSAAVGPAHRIPEKVQATVIHGRIGANVMPDPTSCRADCLNNSDIEPGII